jgi:hypothetical protein
VNRAGFRGRLLAKMSGEKTPVVKANFTKDFKREAFGALW